MNTPRLAQDSQVVPQRRPVRVRAFGVAGCEPKKCQPRAARDTSRYRLAIPVLTVLWWLATTALHAAEPARNHLAVVLAVKGQAEVLRSGKDGWAPLITSDRRTNYLYRGDQIRTRANSEARLQLRDGTVQRLGEYTAMQMVDREGSTISRLFRGVLYFFRRDRPGRYDLESGGFNAGVIGTEFVFQARDDGSILLALYDGEVEAWAGTGPTATFQSGDVVEMRPGESPRKTAVVVFGDWSAAQWALYYPAILDLADLGRTASPVEELAESWRQYQRGNLPQALAAYPADRTPASAEERLFRAALLLSVGNVAEAQRWLEEAERTDRLAPLVAAHRRLIATVLRAPRSEDRAPNTDSRNEESASPGLGSACSWLAESYRLQVEGRLSEARERARAATTHAPGFGFAWVRLAELEFSFGEVRAADRALTRGLELSPDNAEAHALRGFLLAARNRVRDAELAFETAASLDPALGNAWLGRGLCRIRRGDLEAGRADLMVAAASEPQRSVLRSYLAKALLDSKPFRSPALAGKAAHELDLARRLDPKDPTPELYSALLNQQANRINRAITNLERSLALNTNRYVYRSDFLLDQDRAMRGVNLANVYADAGMSEVSVREATRAVNSDYVNASAHLFLANSYNALRDPRQVNLRYEAPWFSEFLLANLLAPVGAGTLSQTVSQNEYSKLFERDGLGVVSETLWTSNGDWLESGAQFGQFGNFEYALDAHYRSEVGQRPNNDLEQLTLSLNAKAQLSLADTAFLQGIYYDAESGDPNQYYDPADANPAVRLHENQEPILLAGWHHEWTPDLHTLALVSPWNARASSTDPLHKSELGRIENSGSIRLLEERYVPFTPLDYTTRYTGWSAELQQSWRVRSHTLIGGLRYQSGEFVTEAEMDVHKIYGPDREAVQDYGASPTMQRFSLYAYDQWQILPWALLTVGVSYDHLEEPVNFTLPPLTGEQQTLDQASPKIGLTLMPWKRGTLRGAYARSLGGVSFDQSYRLEPVQVACFTQSYRGLMPESLVGLVPGQDLEVWGVAFEQQLPTRTYLILEAQQARSDATHGVGAFLDDPRVQAIVPATLTESLDFREDSLAVTVSQLLGDYFALGVNYRLSEAELETAQADVVEGASERRSVLHQVVLGARFNHPCGAFARWDSVWTQQSNREGASDLNGDEFWRHDLWVGWRFWQRRAELAVGVLNLADQDYRLCPLNHHPETYRERTFAVSGRFNF